MLDLGANIECDADNLAEFAVMGSVFAQVLLGLDRAEGRPAECRIRGTQRPRGNAPGRGRGCAARAAPVDFHGFVEGNDIAAGVVDVVVTDGFTGNVALKAIEGTAKLYIRFVRDAFRTSTFAKIGYLFAAGAWMKLRKRVDPRRYNGGVFLGLDGVCVKSHGGTDDAGLCLCDRRGRRHGALRVQDQACRGTRQAAPGHLGRRSLAAGAAGHRRRSSDPFGRSGMRRLSAGQRSSPTTN